VRVPTCDPCLVPQTVVVVCDDTTQRPALWGRKKDVRANTRVKEGRKNSSPRNVQQLVQHLLQREQQLWAVGRRWVWRGSNCNDEVSALHVSCRDQLAVQDINIAVQYQSEPNRVDSTMDRGRLRHTDGDLSAGLGPVSGIETCQWDRDLSVGLGPVSRIATVRLNPTRSSQHAPSHFPAKSHTKARGGGNLLSTFPHTNPSGLGLVDLNPHRLSPSSLIYSCPGPQLHTPPFFAHAPVAGEQDHVQ
jgi:hypothetical protein